MRFTTIAFFATGLALFAVGCQGEDDSLNVSIDADEENICSQYADVMCKNIFECCTGAEIEENFGVKITTDEEQCRRDMQLVCEHSASEYLYAFNSGTATLDKENMDLCLEEMLVVDGQCFPYIPVTQMMPHCNELLVLGQVTTGNTCLFDFECTGDAYCDLDRKCKNFPIRNEACDNNGCATGLYCEWDPETDENTCQPRIKAGQGCSDAMLCLEELYCFPIAEDLIDWAADPVVTGECAALLPLGDTCAANPECETGNCLPGVCGDGSECYENDDCYGVCSGSGDECLSPDDCFGGVCNGGNWDGENCGDNGDCEGNCAASFDNCNTDADCGMVCDVTGDTCADLADCVDGLDTACQADTCDGGGTCDSTQTCDGKTDCAGEHTCVENYGTMNYCAADNGVPIWSPTPIPEG